MKGSRKTRGGGGGEICYANYKMLTNPPADRGGG